MNAPKSGIFSLFVRFGWVGESDRKLRAWGKFVVWLGCCWLLSPLVSAFSTIGKSGDKFADAAWALLITPAVNLVFFPFFLLGHYALRRWLSWLPLDYLLSFFFAVIFFWLVAWLNLGDKIWAAMEKEHTPPSTYLGFYLPILLTAVAATILEAAFAPARASADILDDFSAEDKHT